MKNDLPLVSIGIPTYNRPDRLRSILEYFTKQTYNNIEIIVSDNGSPTDEVQKVVQSFTSNDRRIKFFRQPENRGIDFNFRFVLEQASAEYFMFAQDDDWYDERFVELIMLEMLKNNDAKLGFCRYGFVRNGEELPLYKKSDYTGNVFQRMKKFNSVDDDSACFGIFKKAILSDTHLFATSQHLWGPNKQLFWRQGIPLLYGALAGGAYVYIDEKVFSKTLYNADEWYGRNDPHKHNNKVMRRILLILQRINIAYLGCCAIMLTRNKWSSVLLFYFPIQKEMKGIILDLIIEDIYTNLPDKVKLFIRKVRVKLFGE